MKSHAGRDYKAKTMTPTVGVSGVGGVGSTGIKVQSFLDLVMTSLLDPQGRVSGR